MGLSSEEQRLLGELQAKYPMRFSKAALIMCEPNPANFVSMNTASVTLVELDAGPIAITCNHVITEALTPTESGELRIFKIGDEVIDLTCQLLDRSDDLDIATILLRQDQLSAVLVDNTGNPIGTSLFRPASWPPEPPTEGDIISFGGFPGHFREIINLQDIQFATFSSGATLVSSSSERQFICAFERCYWDIAFGDQLHLDLKSFGGMSGGPAFIFRGLHYDLVGIVKEFEENLDAMVFSSLKWLQADGHIALRII